MRHLKEFQPKKYAPLFPSAHHLPPFFQNNLLDPARVVKFFKNDPQANIRAFYYQYLKLCFELESVDYEMYIHKIEEIVNNQDFKFMFYEDDDPEIFNDSQFKQLMMEFFGLLGQGGVDIEEVLNYYPFIDTVFIYFFRAILILTGRTDSLDSFIDRTELLLFLCTQFNVELNTYGKCMKFQQTDIFLYQQNQSEVYMAYMDYDSLAEQDEEQQQSEKTIQMPPHIQSYDIEPIEINQQELAVILQNKASLDVSPTPSPVSSRRNNLLIKSNLRKTQFLDEIDLSVRTDLASLEKASDLRLMRIEQSNNITNQSSPQRSSTAKSSQVTQYQNKPGYSYNNMESMSLTQQAPYRRSQSPKQRQSFEKSPNYDKDKTLSTDVSTDKLIQQNKVINESVLIKGLVPISTSDLSSMKQSAKDNAMANFQKGLLKPNFQEGISNSFEEKRYLTPHTSPVIEQINKRPNVQKSEMSPNSNLAIHQHQNHYPQYQSQYSPKLLNLNMDSRMNPNIPTSVSRNNCGLNVSIEFTNSFTMKSMKEPYKSNVYNIRERARNYRNSLVRILK